jgi:glycosyltransferase involved in cell wall biosynthesis
VAQLRILILTPEYPPHAGGGIAKYYELVARELAAAGAGVTVLVATPFSSYPDYQQAGVNVRFVPIEEVHRQANHLTHLAGTPTFRRWIGAGAAAAEWVASRRDAFDVVEVADFGLLFAPILTLEDRPPVSVTFHGSVGQIAERESGSAATELDDALARLIETVVLPYADSFQALGEANAREWCNRLNRHVSILSPPLDLPEPIVALAHDRFAGVVVGRIQSWKGPELLCRALSSVVESMPRSVKIAWIGRDTASGPGRSSMSSWLAQTYPGIWGAQVVTVGQLPMDHVATLMASARFIVAPSLWDTFNYTVAESMALGCVTLASDGAGASRLIQHGDNGFRFPANDPHALGALLIKAQHLSDEERDRIGQRARETVARELQPKRAAAALLQALTSMPPTTHKPPDSWVQQFLRPSFGQRVAADHLENVSIRELASHLGSRVKRKIVG